MARRAQGDQDLPKGDRITIYEYAGNVGELGKFERWFKSLALDYQREIRDQIKAAQEGR